MRSDKYLLWLYPRHWRERYEEEMLAMFELRPCSLLDSVDLILGALAQALRLGRPAGCPSAYLRGLPRDHLPAGGSPFTR